MKVKRLEIFGFKSFKDGFVLNFDSDLIGIVGPNGCGKSNIIDALRWVLGESHARQLRGSVQEDLIFNGTEGHKAMGMAEVSVVFETTPGWVPAIGEEVDPEEIKVLQSLEGFGIEGEDGDHEPVHFVGNTEEEIRASFFQVPGIFDASEIQITRRLYRSGESEYFINKVACRLKDIVDLCRTIGLGARGLNIVQQGTIGEIVTRKPIDRRELLEEAAGISGFRARLETALRQLQRTQDNIARLKDIYEEVGKQVRSLKRQAARAQARAEQKEQLRITEYKLYSVRLNNITVRKLEIDKELSEFDAQNAAIKEEIEACQEEYSQTLSADSRIEQELATLRDERQLVRRNLEELREAEHVLQVELARLETRLRSVESGFSQIEERKVFIGQDLTRRCSLIEDLDKKINDLNAKKLQAEAELLNIQGNTLFTGGATETAAGGQFAVEISDLTERIERLAPLTQELADLMSSLDVERKKLKKSREELSEEKASSAALNAEVESLRSQLKALGEHVAKAFSAEGGASESSNIGNVLLAGIEVPASLQRAVSAVLADRANFVVSADTWNLLNSYGDDQEGRKKEMRIGLIDANARVELAEISDIERQIAPSARYLVQSFEISKDYHGPIHALLCNVLLVDTLTEAQVLREHFVRNNHGLLGGSNRVIVTLGGEVICEWGWYSTSGDGAGLSLALRLREQQDKLELVRAQYVEISQRVQVLENEISAAEQIVKHKEEEKKALIQDQRRLSQLLQFVRDAERRERNEALDRERVAQKQVRDLAEELSGLRSRLDNEKKRIGELEAEQDELSRRRDRLLDNERQIKMEQAELHNKIAAERADIEGAENLHNLQEQLGMLEKKMSQLEAERRNSREHLAEKNRAVEELRASLDKIIRDANSLQLEIERGEVESQMLLEEFKRSYGEEAVLPDKPELEEAEQAQDSHALIRLWQEQVQRIRRNLEREGEIDPEVVTRYAEEEKRYQNLTVQLKDLETGAATLERTTKYLKEISRIRFLKTFNFVSEKFAELVPRLYGGGMGRMELINPQDPLSSGIELVVRPPGKQLKSLELLSGGEKALTAIAILVSMFLHRPGPICVMDEVDAPLDDANLGKFMELVREISSRTQFLVVTHNKQTMAVVDRLIGITMQEKGVSTAMEVSFSEAEAELEQWEAATVNA